VPEAYLLAHCARSLSTPLCQKPIYPTVPEASTPRCVPPVLKEMVWCSKHNCTSIPCLQKHFYRKVVQRWMSRLVMKDEWQEHQASWLRLSCFSQSFVANPEIVLPLYHFRFLLNPCQFISQRHLVLLHVSALKSKQNKIRLISVLEEVNHSGAA